MNEVDISPESLIQFILVILIIPITFVTYYYGYSKKSNLKLATGLDRIELYNAVNVVNKCLNNASTYLERINKDKYYSFYKKNTVAEKA